MHHRMRHICTIASLFLLSGVLSLACTQDTGMKSSAAAVQNRGGAMEAIAPATPYQPGPLPIAMIEASKRTPEQWMEYLGVRLVEVRDASGPAAWTPQNGETYFFTNESTTWGATNQRNNVVIIHAKTKKTVAQSNLPDEYSKGFSSHGIAVSADGNWIYLPALGKEPYLLVLDARTLKIHKVYRSLGRPHHVNNFTAPDGRELIMVVDFGWNWQGSGMWVLDPANDNNVVGGANRADLSGHPYVASGDVEGKYLYATVPAPQSSLRGKVEGYLMKVNLETWTIEQAIPVGDPIWPEITADGKTAWVTDGDHSKVWKIDLTSGKVLDEITTGPGPWGARLSYDESKLYVADKGEARGYGQQGRTMTVVDTKFNIVTNVVVIGVTTDHLILSPDGKEVWATSNAAHAIYVVDTEQEKVTHVIAMPNEGDTHGSTFVRYFKDAAGNITGEVVSGFTGLRGSALHAQKEYLQQPVVTLGVDRNGFIPKTVTVEPGAAVRLVLKNIGGTSGGVQGFEAPDAGLEKIELKAGEKREITWRVPQEPKNVEVRNPKNAQHKLTIEVKAKRESPKETLPTMRELTVHAKHYVFDAARLTFQPGETVRITLINADDEKHNLWSVSEELPLRSPDADGGKTIVFEWTASNQPGVYKVICLYHPAMVLEVEIK